MVSGRYKAIARKLGIDLGKDLTGTGNPIKFYRTILGSSSLCDVPYYKEIGLNPIQRVGIGGKIGAMCIKSVHDECGDCIFKKGIFPYNGGVTKGLGLKLQ